MDALLPSEIARLVLGYLQEQKCDEAAKTFMETSPLLRECRIVAQRGGRYSTKVGGLSLMDILDKYCAATIMVQDKIIKVSDSEQLKQCNDLLEQLRYLLEGSTSSRSHRFVVNISVPTQNSPAGSFGSPVVPSSGRKRHHSHSERGKRAARSLSNLLEKSTQNTITQSCDTVEATLLESLPGHKDLIKQTENYGNILNERSPSKTNFIANNFTEDICNFNPTASKHIDPSRTNLNFNIVNKTHQNLATESLQQKDSDQIKNKCTAGTSTDELMSYCNTEVQTSDLLENESDDVDPKREPIETLSIITTELLNRTEIQQRIAENINKARESSSSFHENQEHENGQDAANASMLTDYNNAIKSMVEATDSDPIFEDFIHEIFNVRDIHKTLEENKETQVSNDQFHTRNEPMEVNDMNVSLETKENIQERNGLEVPLKQRLRSSSRSQNLNAEDEEKESNSLLENQNAEAVMSIVNVIANKRNSLNSEESNTETLRENNIANEQPISPKAVPENSNIIELPNNVSEKSSNNEASKNNIEIKQKKGHGGTKTTKPPTKKTVTKKTRPVRTMKPKPEIEEVVTTPTLILCSEQDIGALPQNRLSGEGFFPIAPKQSDQPVSGATDQPQTIYLRTVNVPKHLVNSSTRLDPNNLLIQKALQFSPQPITTDPIVVPIVVMDDKYPTITVTAPVLTPGRPTAPAPMLITTPALTVPISVANTESITLYGSGGDTGSTMNVATPISSLPIINIDESMMGLTTGTGLSPFFKGAIIGEPVVEEKKEEEQDKRKETEDKEKKEQTIQLEQPVEKVPQSDDIIVLQEAMNMDKNINMIEIVEENKYSDVEEVTKENEDINMEEPPEAPPPEEVVILQEKEIAELDKSSQERANLENDKADAIITKRTPKSIMKSRAKNNRLSLSTPRRRNSHVRALDFNTPVKLSSTMKKMPQSCTRSKSVRRAGLFTSPPFTGGNSVVNLVTTTTTTETIKKIKTMSPVKRVYVQVPIATRSPAPKLQGNWNKVAGIGLIIGDISTSESSPEKQPPDSDEQTVTKVLEKEDMVKKSWDSDLRKIIGATPPENQDDPLTKPKSAKKSTCKKKIAQEKSKDKERDRKSREKTKAKKNDLDEKTVLEKNEDEEKKLDKRKDENTKKSEGSAKTSVTVEDAEPRELASPSEVTKLESKSGGNTKKLSKKEVDNVEEKSDINIIMINANPTNTESITPPALVKKAEPKLDSKIKAENEFAQPKTTQDAQQNAPKSITEAFISGLQMPDFSDLETPRKAELKFVMPQTPRFLATPADNLKTARMKSYVDAKLKDCVDTPDFPLTPCIVITPKIVEEDNDKKPSPYYEPDEQTQLVQVKEVANTEKITVKETKTTVTTQENIVEMQENKTIETTRFSVVEQTVVQEEKREEATSLDNSKETIAETSVSNTTGSTNIDIDSGDESDSNSSTSSSSSNSSSSSSSSSGSSSHTSDSSPEKSANTSKESQNASVAEVAIDSPDELVQSFSQITQEELEKAENELKKDEASPEKVFPALRNVSDEEPKETPAKDENAPEADISETPSVSNGNRASRRNSITNLTSKISAIITTSQSEQAARNTINTQGHHRVEDVSTVSSSSDKVLRSTTAAATTVVAAVNKPKIISVQRIVPGEGMTLQVSKMLQSEIQRNTKIRQQQETIANIHNAKLGMQLEEKRQRVMAKFKEANNPKQAGQLKKSADDGKQKKVLATTKKGNEAEKIVSSTTDNLKSKQNVKAEIVMKKDEKVMKPQNTNKEEVKKAEDLKEKRKCKGKGSPKKVNIPSEQINKTENNLKKSENEKTQNVAKEVTTAVATMAIENSKGIAKSKVDQVKRDLFSDEEVNDQRTTRSQTAKRTADGQKNDENKDSKAQIATAKETLPGVLECLELRPTNKSDPEVKDEDQSSNNYLCNSSTNQEIRFEYNGDSMPYKKRKLKYSNSELNEEQIFQLEDGRMEILHLSPFEDLFRMTPCNKKKLSSPKKSPTKIKKIKTFDKNVKPSFVTSSPIIQASSSTESKKTHVEEKRKKQCKRKPTSPIKEGKQVEKKSKPDPALINTIKIDEFLKRVHVPE